MTFTVTYRDKGGALREETVEAAGRAECFAQMKARGIVPVSVREGRAKRARSQDTRDTRDTRDRRRTSVPGVMGVMGVLAVLALGLWLWIGREDAPPPAEKPKAEKRPVAQPPRPKAAPAPAATNAPAPAATNKPAPPRSAPPAKDMTKEERAELLLKKIEERPPDLTPTSNKVFRTALEMTIAGIFTCPLGKPPPPLPRIPVHEEVHLEAILNAPNVVLETDSEKAAYAKKAVELAKKELKDYVAKGGDPQEFLSYYHGQLRQASMEFNESRRQVLQSLKEDPELGAAMLKEVNKRLEAKGIMPVELPQHLRDRYGIE